MIVFPPPDPYYSEMANKKLNVRTPPDRQGDPLVEYITEFFQERNEIIKSLIEFGAVWINGKACADPYRRLRSGEEISIQVPIYGPVRFYEIQSSRILYEDEFILAYDKEPGIPCQQTPYDGYNNIYFGLKRKTGAYLALHHRLDAPTSGVMLFARHKKVNAGLGKLFQGGLIDKRYLALVKGRPVRESWTTDRAIAKNKGKYECPDNRIGKPAVTEFQIIETGSDSSLLLARPLTGRTHQIRLHLKADGLPIVGDQLYGGPKAERLYLHALSLQFDHPAHGRPLRIESPRPKGF